MSILESSFFNIQVLVLFPCTMKSLSSQQELSGFYGNGHDVQRLGLGALLDSGTRLLSSCALGAVGEIHVSVNGLTAVFRF